MTTHDSFAAQIDGCGCDPGATPASPVHEVTREEATGQRGAICRSVPVAAAACGKVAAAGVEVVGGEAEPEPAPKRPEGDVCVLRPGREI